MANGKLADGSGPVQLRGVNRAGGEYMCLTAPGHVFEGPTDDASIAAIKSWGANAVRLPLNESCWLGADGATDMQTYRSQVIDFVKRLRAAGLYVILDAHYSTADSKPARAIFPLLDEAHGPAFWRSLADTFKSTDGLVFDLYNEPHDVSWDCWRDGCQIPSGSAYVDEGGQNVNRTYASYKGAGMQELVDAIRGAGANQPIMVGGLGWATDFSGWQSHEPHDPLGELVASHHTYGPNANAACDSNCRSQLASLVSAGVPVVTGEMGEFDCASGYVSDFMTWADNLGIGYLLWAWNAGGEWACGSGPSLISNYDGTPTPYGAGVKSHLLSRA